ncbi:MAG: ImuA family protein [Pseudolabrys sp.]
MPAALHEIVPERMPDLGAACGFAAALAARSEPARGKRRREVLWIQTDFATLESGRPYGPGYDLFGLPTRRLLVLTVPRPVDLLWAMEEALRSRALAAVIGELSQDGAAADLTATRRLTLAAREGDSLGLLLRHQPSSLTSSAETRWQVAAAPSRPDRFGGLGRTAFALSLTKNRRGPTGRWHVAWDHHECAFSALSLGVVAAAVDRSDRTPLVRAG